MAMRRRRLAFGAALLICICASFLIAHVEAKRKPQPDVIIDADAGVDVDAYPDVHYLFEWIGKEMYALVDCPKYRFFIRLTGYSLPDERTTIVALSTIANVLYGCSVVFGFLFFPRGPMLFWTLVTLYVGPAVILLLIGAHVALLVAFATHPVPSVLGVWLWFFLTSRTAQALGRYLGLDHDGDGDVDAMDLVHYLAQTKIGKWVGLEVLHDKLNRMSMDPFQAIHHRLDGIQRKMEIEAELRSKEVQKDHSD